MIVNVLVLLLAVHFLHLNANISMMAEEEFDLYKIGQTKNRINEKKFKLTQLCWIGPSVSFDLNFFVHTFTVVTNISFDICSSLLHFTSINGQFMTKFTLQIKKK